LDRRVEPNVLGLFVYILHELPIGVNELEHLIRKRFFGYLRRCPSKCKVVYSKDIDKGMVLPPNIVNEDRLECFDPARGYDGMDLQVAVFDFKNFDAVVEEPM
jgi:hypothetical protein